VPEFGLLAVQLVVGRHVALNPVAGCSAIHSPIRVGMVENGVACRLFRKSWRDAIPILVGLARLIAQEELYLMLGHHSMDLQS